MSDPARTARPSRARALHAGAVLAGAIAACGDDVTRAPAIQAEVSASTLIVGDSAQATAAIVGAESPSLRWTSSDTTVVRVGATAWFHAVGEGSAMLSARRTGSGEEVGRIAVSVAPGVVVTPPTAEIRVGGAATLEATVEGLVSGAERRVRWTSSDTTVATVSDSGIVTGLRLGAVRIEARPVSRPTTYGRATVTVAQSVLTALFVEPSSPMLAPGATLQLRATLREDSGTSSDVTYASSDTRVATVSTTGLVTALQSGVTIISVAAVRNARFRTTATVNVREPGARLQRMRTRGGP